jgi:hypothetical protein
VRTVGFAVCCLVQELQSYTGRVLVVGDAFLLPSLTIATRSSKGQTLPHVNSKARFKVNRALYGGQKGTERFAYRADTSYFSAIKIVFIRSELARARSVVLSDHSVRSNR